YGLGILTATAGNSRYSPRLHERNKNESEHNFMARYLHTSIFVNNMDESIDFYTKKLGLKLLGGPDHYPGNADMAFVGANWDAYIELVYDLEDHPPYQVGNRYEHLALEVDGNLAAICEKLESQGVKVLKGPK